MEISNFLWTVGGLAFFTGLVMGVLLYHYLAANGGAALNNARIAELEAELKEYQTKVADHFSTSAHLINRMTESYRNIHDHLAESANKLCTDELTRHRLDDALLSSQVIHHTEPEQPKDYAPKPASGEHTLAENFRVSSDNKQSIKQSIGKDPSAA